MHDSPYIGQTRDTGFQIGVRRTLAAPLETVWALLISPAGTRIWLGDGIERDLISGVAFQLADGTSGVVRVFSPNAHLRLTRNVVGWPRASTVQMRVLASGDRTTVAFHEEHLPGPGEREAQRQHYSAALATIAALIPDADKTPTP